MSQSPLFAANNHSAFEISFRPADAERCRLITAALQEQYPFASVAAERIQQVNEAEQASNNFRVEAVTENGGVCILLVRKHILLAKEEDILFLEKTLAFLQEKNIPAPQLIATRNGELRSTFGGSTWHVYTFIDGNHYSGQSDELVAAAKGLASLHRALAEFPYQEELQRKAPAVYPFAPEGLEKVLEAAVRKQNEIDMLFCESATFLHEMSATWKQFGEGEDRTQVIHGDMHPHNTLFAGGSLRAFIDFDMMLQAELLREVGFAAHRFSRQYAVRQDGGAQAAVAGFQQFLKAYCEENPLTLDEQKRLPRLMIDELLRRIVTDFSRYYFEGSTRFATVQELQKKITLLQEAEHLSHYVNS